MASDQNFVDFICEQVSKAGTIQAKKMFGEYGLYADGQLFGLICDNKLFIKPTAAGRAFIGEPVEAAPYPGAKNSFLIEAQLENAPWLCELLKVSLKELPPPKVKKPKSPKK